MDERLVVESLLIVSHLKQKMSISEKPRRQKKERTPVKGVSKEQAEVPEKQAHRIDIRI